MVVRVRLDAIAFDAGTQIRAALDQQVVSDYAEAMTAGAQFPPIVLFHDGNRHYLADGFHRYMAAERNQWREIDADVRAGTQQDALWFALGANKANGKRLSEADKTHAVAIALKTWPEKMQREIAEQVGCHPSLVSEVYRKTTASEPVLRGRALLTENKRVVVRELVAAGELTAEEIAERAKVSRTLVTDVRAEMGLSRLDKSKAAVAQRRKDIADMAERGFATRQIAAAVGISEQAVKDIAKAEGVVIHADRVIGKTHKHDSDRIVERMALDAASLCADVNLIEFADIDRARIPEWLEQFQVAREQLGGFIRRLMKEQQKHGEAA